MDQDCTCPAAGHQPYDFEGCDDLVVYFDDGSTTHYLAPWGSDADFVRQLLAEAAESEGYDFEAIVMFEII